MKQNCRYFLVVLNKTKKDWCLCHLFFWLFKRIDLLADKYGRKHILMICLSITVFAGIMESLSVNFWMYLFFQTLGSLGQAGCFQTGFILALETVGKSHRYVLFFFESFYRSKIYGSWRQMTFLTFPADFWIPIIFFNFNSNCYNLLDLRNLQEQVKKAFCYQK